MNAVNFLACHFVQSSHMTRSGAVRMMAHDHHELIYVVRGDYQVRVRRRAIAVEPGQYLFYPKGLPHQVLTPPDYITTIICLQWDDVAAELGHAGEVGPHADPGHRIQQNLELLADIRDETPGPLHQAYLVTILEEMRYASRGGEVSDDRLTRIKRLLDDWPGMEISVSFLCDRFSISKSVLQRQFRERTGMSVIDYLRRSRARRAVRLLQAGQASADVADKVGIKTVPALSRLLKQAYDRGIRDFRQRGGR